ncbi:MAG: SDR family NAD(P)-dependent oxidoreductase [Myxococcota bacterium]|nr:SDR family NAD(P)-dependent oxidoreductase [Myxococcota bacterium]
MVEITPPIEGPIRALVVGARGGVGEAIADALAAMAQVELLIESSQDSRWVAEAPLDLNARRSRCQLKLPDPADGEALAESLDTGGVELNLIINCVGLLHDARVQPERRLGALDVEQMRTVFEVNCFALATLLQVFTPRLPRRGRVIFASLSARVGSIGDNRLGGWHSYRSSKAAHNMLIKGASIELRRRNPELLCIALHPGTVDSDLSRPFQKRVPPEKLFSPEQSAAYLLKVIAALGPEASGGFFAWDGAPIEW